MRATIAAGQWPDEGRRRTDGQTLLEVWARHWQARPDLPVLVDGWHAERVREAAELDRRTAQMATVLAHSGAPAGGPRHLARARVAGDRAGSPRRVMRAGGVVVPLNIAATDGRGGARRARRGPGGGPHRPADRETTASDSKGSAPSCSIDELVALADRADQG